MAQRVRSRPPLLEAAGRGAYWQRRFALATPDAVRLLRRRRRIATCLACISGAFAFFGLYALSWVLVLDL